MLTRSVETMLRYYSANVRREVDELKSRDHGYWCCVSARRQYSTIPFSALRWPYQLSAANVVRHPRSALPTERRSRRLFGEDVSLWKELPCSGSDFTAGGLGCGAGFRRQRVVCRAENTRRSRHRP